MINTFLNINVSFLLQYIITPCGLIYYYWVVINCAITHTHPHWVKKCHTHIHPHPAEKRSNSPTPTLTQPKKGHAHPHSLTPSQKKVTLTHTHPRPAKERSNHPHPVIKRSYPPTPIHTQPKKDHKPPHPVKKMVTPS